MVKVCIFLVCIIITIDGVAQDVRSQLKLIADDITHQIQLKSKKRVAIASFLDLQNRETELGRYMSDKFSIGMGTSSLEVLDRSQLSQLMLENNLAAKSILDPKTIPNLGRLAGVDVIIIGNYAALDNSVDITVKAIDVQRGVRIAVAEGTVSRTAEVNKLLNEVSDAISIINSENNSGTNPSDVKVPKPSADCQAKSTCVLCITNKYSEPVEVLINYFTSFPGNKNLYIYPGKTQCWQEVYILPKENYVKKQVWYKINGTETKRDQLIIERCKTYSLVFNK